MSIAYITAHTLRAFRDAATRSNYRIVADIGYWIARAAKVVRRLLPGIRCEASGPCCARGGFSIAAYDGDDGGGYSMCRWHAEEFAEHRVNTGGHALVIPHVCDETCDHTTESEWT